MAYTGRNLPQSTTVAVGTAEQATTSTTYYLDQRTETQTDFNGNVTSYTWGVCCARIQSVADPAADVDDTGPAKSSATTTWGDRDLAPGGG